MVARKHLLCSPEIAMCVVYAVMLIRNESVPIQLAQFLVPWAGHFSVPKYKYIFQIKYTEEILSDNTQKVLWFEITKC